MLRAFQRPQAALQILHTSIFYENFLLGFMPFFKQAHSLQALQCSPAHFDNETSAACMSSTKREMPPAS